MVLILDSRVLKVTQNSSCLLLFGSGTSYAGIISIIPVLRGFCQCNTRLNNSLQLLGFTHTLSPFDWWMSGEQFHSIFVLCLQSPRNMGQFISYGWILMTLWEMLRNGPGLYVTFSGQGKWAIFTGPSFVLLVGSMAFTHMCCLIGVLQGTYLKETLLLTSICRGYSNILMKAKNTNCMRGTLPTIVMSGWMAQLKNTKVSSVNFLIIFMHFCYGKILLSYFFQPFIVSFGNMQPSCIGFWLA